ncbi:hypothetical protein [Microcoleus sp. FACHB-672]|uniref:hypothetical protein n=1 Tax=Microcoleus sp. FACHB-672 TaxID=2692825 RepID=UPI001685DE25|nr:hypothetical protein [Microcoleus sp. FACHB-672]MBD2042974.1 hypothetical protein [Microcoleus sp. FACHB-672]
MPSSLYTGCIPDLPKYCSGEQDAPAHEGKVSARQIGRNGMLLVKISLPTCFGVGI